MEGALFQKSASRIVEHVSAIMYIYALYVYVLLNLFFFCMSMYWILLYGVVLYCIAEYCIAFRCGELYSYLTLSSLVMLCYVMYEHICI